MSKIGFVRNILKFKLLFASVWLQKTHYKVCQVCYFIGRLGSLLENSENTSIRVFFGLGVPKMFKCCKSCKPCIKCHIKHFDFLRKISSSKKWQRSIIKVANVIITKHLKTGLCEKRTKSKSLCASIWLKKLNT